MNSKNDVECFDALVVGAGFGGVYMLYRLKQLGLRVCGVEAASDVGGAWYWNRYPGARCDVESLLYSYSFSAELDAKWKWSERYATQPEIQAYISFAADELDVRQHIVFDTRVVSAHYNDATCLWSIETSEGRRLLTRFFVMAAGPLTIFRYPDIEGVHDFKGETYHTARWPSEKVNFAGKRVGVIGNGSSGTQAIPLIAAQAEHLDVFIRTAHFSVPAKNAPLTEVSYARWNEEKVRLRSDVRAGRITGAGDTFIASELLEARRQPAASFSEARQQELLDLYWNSGGAILAQCFSDVASNEQTNSVVADYARRKIAQIIQDPDIAGILTPRGYPFGGKRLVVDSHYYETFNRQNVRAVDVATAPIERVTATGIRTRDNEYPLDVIVYATGFDAMSGAFDAIDIRGRGGLLLKQAWAEGPRTFMGVSVAGFPNMLIVNGPGAPSVFSNVASTNELIVEALAELVAHMKIIGALSCEITEEAQDAWVDHNAECANRTVFSKTDNWYLGANVPGKPRVLAPYSGGVASYSKKLQQWVDEGFHEVMFGHLTETSHAASAKDKA
ncbi:flavin-containing monooxygenase [Pseudomonas sp. NFX224]|uniref:flavin-containing monooxygenase n=1 Tax=Pseudomonas sp. NFX224 TaxID=3402862 RepID=UPI003AFAE5A3